MIKCEVNRLLTCTTRQVQNKKKALKGRAYVIQRIVPNMQQRIIAELSFCA